jgi:hypothetical protein
LITAHGAIHKPGTDTWRLANAGAVAVAWIISLRDAAPAAVEAAMAYLAAKGSRGVVIEGTTALEWIDPRISVMVATDPGRRWKDVALRNVGRCSIVLRSTPPEPSGDVPAPAAFAASTPVPCDFGAPADPGTRWYEARVRELAA